jgi:hypothetical protein
LKDIISQGVALGWYVMPLWGLGKQSGWVKEKNFYPCYETYNGTVLKLKRKMQR